MNMSESLTSELWLKIDQLHLKYLQSEDTPSKLDIRKKLEGECLSVLMYFIEDVDVDGSGCKHPNFPPRPGGRLPVHRAPAEEVRVAVYWGHHLQLRQVEAGF